MLKFRTHKDASIALGLSIKLTRKEEGRLYVLDKSIPNPQIKWKICKECKSRVPSSKCRGGYCSTCTKAGLGHKNSGNPNNIKWTKCKICKSKVHSGDCRSGYCKQCTSAGLGYKAGGKKLSKTFSGKGNPNYVHGNTKQSQADRKNQWYSWGRFIFHKYNYQCVISGRKDDLQCHHIIPFSVLPSLRFSVENGVVLNRFYHIELHRQLLDLQLLPSLALSAQDAQELAEWFVLQPQVQSLLQLPYCVHGQHELIRVAGQNANHQRQLSALHPEFDLSALDHLAS